MLRYAFLPSDFHPQFLILGERSELAGLVDILRRFADNPASVEIEHESAPDPRRDVRLRMAVSDESTGLHRSEENATHFEWRLNAQGAAAIALMVEETIASSEPAGSVVLQVGAADEIPVKVSYGEFTSEFLIEDF